MKNPLFQFFTGTRNDARIAFAAITLSLVSSMCCAAEDPVASVRLGYFPNVTHAQALIGVQRGDFQKAIGPDIKLETTTFNAGPSVIEAVFGNRLDIAYVGPSPTINGYLKSRGEEIRVVAGAAVNGVLIVANKKRNITKLEELRGKKIATPQLGNTQDISAKNFVVENLKTTLKEKGGDTEVIPVENPNIEILFEKDQLDAAWVPEPWGSRLIDKGLANLVAEEKDLWPAKKFALTNIIVRREFLDKHPDLVKKILAAHIAITHELQAKPESFIPLINSELKRLTAKDLPKPVIESSLKHLEFTTDPAPDSFKRFYEMGVALKLLKPGEFDVSKLIDTRLLQEILKSAPAQPAAAKAANQ